MRKIALTLVWALELNGQSSGKVRMTLAEAQAAAIKGRASLGKLAIDAARFHRQAAQADYFPKIGSSFANLHFNKFMGQQIQVANRTASVPLLDRDLTIVSVTAIQPITPLFKVRQAVSIAKADERITQAKVAAGGAQIAAEVEKAYMGLLIAQEREAEAEAKVASIRNTAGRQTQAVTEATKELSLANIQVSDLTQSFAVLIGVPPGTQLELTAPPPIAGTTPTAQAMERAISRHPEVVEAAQTLEKARAAVRVSKNMSPMSLSSADTRIKTPFLCCPVTFPSSVWLRLSMYSTSANARERSASAVHSSKWPRQTSK